MRMPRTFRTPGRLVLAVSLAGVTAFAAAAPAQAAPVPGSDAVELSVPDRVVTTAGRAKTVPIEVVNTGDTALAELLLDYATGTGPVDPRIGFQPPAGCTTAGCVLTDLAPGARTTLSFTVQPTADLPATGAGLGITVHDKSGAWAEKTTVTVVRAAQGIDLETAAVADIELAPGKSAPLPISVRNNGDVPTDGVAVALVGTGYTTFPNEYSNCSDIADRPGIVCVFDVTVEPGAVFSVKSSTPLTVRASADAPGPAGYHSGLSAFATGGEAPDPEVAAAVRKLAARGPAAKRSGNRLELEQAAPGVAADPELNAWDNSVAFLVKVGLNPADLVAVGDDFEGSVGGTRTVKVGFRNAGPAVVLGPDQKFALSAKVRIPSGLKLTAVDDDCVPYADGEPVPDQPGRVSGHDYLCVAPAVLAPGKQKLFAFTAKIENGRNEDKGSITVRGGVQDKNTANNQGGIKVKVKLKVAATGGGTTGGGGTGGGGLPITGAPAGTVAASGLLLMLAGALLLVFTRRRPEALPHQ